MKKLCFLILVIVSSVLASCAGNTVSDPFSLFSGDFEADISMTCDGNASEYVYRGGEKSISFSSPSELSGFILKKDGETVTMSYGEVSVSLSAFAGRLVYICESVFSAENEDIRSIKASKDGDVTVTEIKTEDYTYRFSSDGIPLSVSGVYKEIPFEMTFSSFTGDAE